MSAEHQIPILLSSSPNAGAFNVSPGNDKFDIFIDQEIEIPNDAKRITVEVQNASIWFTPFNISAALGNNLLYLDVSGDAIYMVTLADGLYDLSALAHSINVGLVNQGLASNIITFTPDLATQKVIINYSVSGIRIDFTQPNTIRSIIGFANAVVPVAYTTGVISIYGANEATFNQIDYFLIHTDLVNGGIRVNGRQTNVVARVLVNSTVGSQILYQPHEAVRVPAQSLAGRKISNIRSWVTDQSNNSLDFGGESWSYSLLIRFYM